MQTIKTIHPGSASSAVRTKDEMTNGVVDKHLNFTFISELKTYETLLVIYGMIVFKNRAIYFFLKFPKIILGSTAGKNSIITHRLFDKYQ